MGVVKKFAEIFDKKIGKVQISATTSKISLMNKKHDKCLKKRYERVKKRRTTDWVLHYFFLIANENSAAMFLSLLLSLFNLYANALILVNYCTKYFIYCFTFLYLIFRFDKFLNYFINWLVIIFVFNTNYYN